MTPALAGRIFITRATWEALFLVIPYANVFERYIGVSETLARNLPTVWTTLKQKNHTGYSTKVICFLILNLSQGGGVEACLWGSFSY